MSLARNELDADIENRVVGLRRTKRDDPHTRANIPQASKRAALGVISTNAVRIQPFRNAKIYQNYSENGQQDENTVPASLTEGARANKEPTFTIHHDTISETETSDVPESSSCMVTTSVRLQIHPGITNLQRPPLTALHVKEQTDEDVDSGSPMVLDVSVEDRSRHSDKHSSLYVSEYSQEIYQHLREAELRHRPKPHYLKKQPDITAGMRSILVDWLVEVGEEYKLQTETLYLAVNYIDRFLSYMSVLRGKLQLVGTACMFIAAKFEEIYPPEVGEFVYITDDTYTKKQVLRMEHLILKVLSFDLAIPTIFYFLERFCKISHANEVVEYLGMYLCELTLLEADPYLCYLPSIIAGSALCLSHFMCGKEMWSEELRILTGYDVNEFTECLLRLHKSLSSAPNFPQQAVREKYRSHKFLAVADISVPVMLPF